MDIIDQIIEAQLIKLLKQRLCLGQLNITLPNGASHIVGNYDDELPIGNIVIYSYRFLWRLYLSGDIGFFDSYAKGEWDSPNLFALMQVLSANLDNFAKIQNDSILKKTIHGITHVLRPNSKSGSKKNIYAHYDLGNDFYSQWLDESMTYSAAIFDNDLDLNTAQNRKYKEIAKSVNLQAGQSVLEIGCGWGGFAVYAAEVIGANVTCVTISNAQYEFAKKRINDRGLEGKVNLLLCDYRDIKGQFDAIVSIEMFEAVGYKYWSDFFRKIKEVLKPNGMAGLQIITIHDDLFDKYIKSVDFIQTYVFPGGFLPSIKKLKNYTIEKGFETNVVRKFGHDYARTLQEWHRRFNSAWSNGRIKGYDEKFKKLWNFYLAYCNAGFLSDRTDVIHLTLKRAS